MKIGLFPPVGGKGMMGGADPTWTDLLAMVQRAEEVGFDFVSVLDHVLFGHKECWTLLSAFAARTTRMELISYVSCTGYRNPALLAKMAATVDEISNGRLILGLGAGDSESEHRKMGYPLDHLVSRFEEAVEVITTLLRKGSIDHDGRFYQVRDFELDSGSPRKQGPPILIGSLGGPRMQRITASYADIWVASYPMNNNTIEGLQLSLERLYGACERVGRDPAEIERMTEVLVGYPGGQPEIWTEMTPISGTPEEIADALRARQALGFDYLHVWIEPNSLAGIEQFAPVLELLR
jgi:alkanesulfonate monooxygenase SsuD/methylene tetrahydromethanopterin reductase-like flavin-dependent oxidoreductase (luciferase family)